MNRLLASAGFLIGALLALMMILAGCSAISTGTITNKSYSPGYLYTSTSCQLIGKNTVCTPHTLYQPEVYRFDLSEGGKEGFVHVNEATYNKYEIGDYYG